MKRICLIVSSELTVTAFLITHLRALCTRYQVTVVANTSDPGFLVPYGLRDVEVFPVAIARDIKPIHDLFALVSLFVFFRRRSFDLIHSITPKAGLLSMVAGAITGIPVRLHTFTGQVWATRSGWMRRMLMTMDRILAKAATSVLADSCSQKDFLVSNGIVSNEKSTVLAHGSICGVDVKRFKPDSSSRFQIRAKYNLSDDHIVFLYVGRLNRDKGVLDLARAFRKVGHSCNGVCLLYVGPDESGMRLQIEEICNSVANKVHFEGYTSTPERYMAAADVFCLPSFREGFGTVIIEAAAAGIPAIASRIYGIIDAVEENETGLFVNPGSVNELAVAMQTMASQSEKRLELGRKAQQRACELFTQDRVTHSLLDYYEKLFGVEDR